MVSQQQKLVFLAGGTVTLFALGFLIYYKKSKREELNEDEFANLNVKNVASVVQSVVEVEVPQRIVGDIIGKGGINIRQLKSDFGVRFDFEKEQGAAVDKEIKLFRTLVIKGEREKVHAAEKKILDLISNAPEYVKTEILVPQKACGRIIGKGGQNIRDMSTISGAKIIVDRNEDYSIGNQRRVFISGKSAQVEYAKGLINEKVEEDRYHEYERKSNSDIDVRTSAAKSLNFPTVILPVKGEVFKMFVSACESPSSFWVQLVTEESTELDSMIKELSHVYKDNKECLLQGNVGEVCVAPFAHDQSYYRARINRFNNNRTVDLIYIDFGDKGQVQIDSLYKLKDEYKILPAQAVQCCLSVVPKESWVWPINVKEEFESLTHCAQWVPLIGRVVNHQQTPDGVLPVLQLIDQQNNNTDISSVLVEKGFALDINKGKLSNNIQDKETEETINAVSIDNVNSENYNIDNFNVLNLKQTSGEILPQNETVTKNVSELATETLTDSQDPIEIPLKEERSQIRVRMDNNENISNEKINVVDEFQIENNESVLNRFENNDITTPVKESVNTSSNYVTDVETPVHETNVVIENNESMLNPFENKDIITPVKESVSTSSNSVSDVETPVHETNVAIENNKSMLNPFENKDIITPVKESVSTSSNSVTDVETPPVHETNVAVENNESMLNPFENKDIVTLVKGSVNISSNVVSGVETPVHETNVAIENNESMLTPFENKDKTTPVKESVNTFSNYVTGVETPVHETNVAIENNESMLNPFENKDIITPVEESVSISSNSVSEVETPVHETNVAIENNESMLNPFENKDIVTPVKESVGTSSNSVTDVETPLHETNVAIENNESMLNPFENKDIVTPVKESLNTSSNSVTDVETPVHVTNVAIENNESMLNPFENKDIVTPVKESVGTSSNSVTDVETPVHETNVAIENNESMLNPFENKDIVTPVKESVGTSSNSVTDVETPVHETNVAIENNESMLNPFENKDIVTPVKESVDTTPKCFTEVETNLHEANKNISALNKIATENQIKSNQDTFANTAKETYDEHLFTRSSDRTAGQTTNEEVSMKGPDVPGTNLLSHSTEDQTIDHANKQDELSKEFIDEGFYRNVSFDDDFVDIDVSTVNGAITAIVSEHIPSLRPNVTSESNELRGDQNHHDVAEELQRSLDKTSRKNVMVSSMELARENLLAFSQDDVGSYLSARSNITITDTDDTTSFFTATEGRSTPTNDLSVSVPDLSSAESFSPLEVTPTNENCTRSSSKFEIQFIDESTNSVMSRENLSASLESSLKKSVSKESLAKIGKETTV